MVNSILVTIRTFFITSNIRFTTYPQCRLQTRIQYCVIPIPWQFCFPSTTPMYPKTTLWQQRENQCEIATGFHSEYHVGPFPSHYRVLPGLAFFCRF